MDAFQRDTRDNFELLSNMALLGGTVIRNVVVATGANRQFSHGLGRVPQGFIVIDRTAGTANLTRVSWDDKFITFTVLANVTVSLYVF
jgi:hypothetical protein